MLLWGSWVLAWYVIFVVATIVLVGSMYIYREIKEKKKAQ